MRQKDEQESNHPILPSHQTRQRPFQAMDMEYLIRVIFVLVGMDRIAILVDLPKVGGLPMNSIFRTRSFGYRKWRCPCKRRERGVNSTLHRARFTHANFSRAWRKAQIAAISLSQQESFLRACYVSHFA